MNVDFTIYLYGDFPGGLTDGQIHLLHEADCNDCTICCCDGVVRLEFCRECGDDPDETVAEAVHQVRRAGFSITMVSQEATDKQKREYDEVKNRKSHGMHSATHIQDLTERHKAVQQARLRRRLHKAQVRNSLNKNALRSKQ